MKKIHIVVYIILAVSILCGCSRNGTYEPHYVRFASYRDIPGVTEQEIAAVAELRARYDYFVYGMCPNSEMFRNIDGEPGGFGVLFSDWLAELFDIPFVVQSFGRSDLLEGLASREISFTGELTASEERRRMYFMTDPIAVRTLRTFRLEDSPTVHELSQIRLPRFAIPYDTTIARDVMTYAAGTFESVFFVDYADGYDLLVSGQADALITEGIQEYYFDTFSDIVSEAFLPLLYSPVSLSTQTPELEPIISIVQKAIDNGAVSFFNTLYNRGHQDYLRNKMQMRLTDEERAFIANNPVIIFGSEIDNYPSSFFHPRDSEWQGIAHDVLREIEMLTGLTFQVGNCVETQWHEMLAMLESGELSLITEVIRTHEREERFIWTENTFIENNYMLISRAEYPNININEVLSARVGLTRKTAYTEMFIRWFPYHANSVIFDSHSDNFDALINGDIDLMMANNSGLLYLTHFLEMPGFKANLVFSGSYEATFGFNKDEVILRSIMDKAMGIIDTQTITRQWMMKTFDYRSQITEARLPLLTLSSVLAAVTFVAFAFVFVLLVKSRRIGKWLEAMVTEKTRDLELQTATLTTLFDSIPNLIVSKDLDLRYVHCNKRMLEHYNLSREDVIGKTDSDIFPESTGAFAEADRIAIVEERQVTYEKHFPAHDGANPLFEVIKTPLFINGMVAGVVSIAHDITQRKEMVEAAIEASRIKSTFLANMSHEIRTPMNAILGVTEILLAKKDIPTEIDEGLERIYSSCNLLLGIINDILDFSKIEAGKMDIIDEEYKVEGLINDTILLNMMSIGDKPIEFKLHLNENIPAQLIGDELRIKQILNNLLSNAFKYTEAGKVTLTVDFEKHNGEITLMLAIKDTGQGMSEEQLLKLFDEYARFNSETNNVEGTGLGLPITKRLIELMNGHIKIESEQNKGTNAKVTLPQKVRSSRTLGRETAESLNQLRLNYINNKKRKRITRDPMPYGSVLLVDDVETNMYIAERLLKLYSLNIDTALSGNEAIRKIKNGNVYDIIFMDHMMPEMDGMEATRHIRDAGYTKPIIALTANAVMGQAEAFLSNGFDEFMSKPIDIRQLDAILNRYIRDKQPQEVIDAAREQITQTTRPARNTLLLESFVQDAGKALSILEEVAQNDWALLSSLLHRYMVTMHGMKSSLYNIGETDLSEIAKKLEQAGVDANLGLIKASTPGFIERLKEIKQKHEPAPEENSEQESDETLEAKLAALQEMCADYNRLGALNCLSKIKNSSDEVKAVLADVKEMIIHSDFEEAENALISLRMRRRK